MGRARTKWDEAKHFRGYHGRFAEGIDRSPEQLGETRGNAAFRPKTPAAERRALKERLPTRVREIRDIYDRRARGEHLTRQEENKISWASPKKIAEQRAKTGDAVVPRGEMVKRERSYANSALRATTPRTGIKKTFTGKAMVERGNYREYWTPTPGRAGSLDLKLEDRVRRPFDWRPTGKKKTARSLMSSKPAPVKPVIPAYSAITTDARIREIATSLGIEIPKRAGRNQIVKLIEERR